MASKLVEKVKEEEPEIDLTPMIDCVFQLIIFFMIVSDMINSDVSYITMPRASHAKEDKDPPEHRMTVNVVHRDENGWKELYEVRRKRYSLARLGELIQQHADGSRTDGRLSDNAVIIRADAHVSWKSVQEVQKKCMEARLWKIAFGATRIINKDKH